MRYHLSCLRLVNSKITKVVSPPTSLLLLPIRDNATDEETVDEGLEVGIDAENPDGIQCVNCGVWGRLSHSDFGSGQTRARPRIRTRLA